MLIIKIKIPTPKGAIAAVVHQPDTSTNQLAVLCPGYLDSKDHAHLVALAHDLCNNGFIVVRFDPTGTWESEGELDLYTTSQYLEDIKNVLGYMLSQKAYNFTLLAGHSRGGQLALLYAARDSTVSQVLAIEPSSNRTMTGKRYEDWKKLGFSISVRDVPGTSNEKKEFRIPYAHVEDRMKYDVVQEVKKIHSPILLISGDLDEVVRPEFVQEIYDNANEPKKLVVITGIGHDYRFSDEQIQYVNKEILKVLI